jgi:hypothetical protein
MNDVHLAAFAAPDGVWGLTAQVGSNPRTPPSASILRLDLASPRTHARNRAYVRTSRSLLRTVPPKGQVWDERCLRQRNDLTPSLLRFGAQDSENRPWRSVQDRAVQQVGLRPQAATEDLCAAPRP